MIPRRESSLVMTQQLSGAKPAAAGARRFAGSSSACHPAPATVWRAACGSAARNGYPGRRPELRDRNLSSCRSALSGARTSKCYILVAGSGTGLPGHIRLQELHRPLRTNLNSSYDAGTTTASPLARVTGSMPWASTTPHPSTATRICTELLPVSSPVRNPDAAPSVQTSPPRNRARPLAETGGSCCAVSRGAGRITFPDPTFSFTTASPPSDAIRADARNHTNDKSYPTAAGSRR